PMASMQWSPATLYRGKGMLAGTMMPLEVVVPALVSVPPVRLAPERVAPVPVTARVALAPVPPMIRVMVTTPAALDQGKAREMSGSFIRASTAVMAVAVSEAPAVNET